MKQLSGIKYWVNALDSLVSGVDDLQVLYEMTAEMQDEESEKELEREHASLLSKIEEVEAKSMLGEEGDNLGALLKINSGAGGTESNDWSSMLLRMYTRWGERNGYKVSVYDVLDGDEAGLKSATIEFEGDFAYGYLKAEN